MTEVPEIAPSGRRQRLLRAIGVTPYRLRARLPHCVSATAAAPADGIGCVLVLPQACPKRPLAVLEKALAQLPHEVSTRIARVMVIDGEVDASIPVAATCLAFGTAQAAAVERCLGRETATDVSVVTLDAPDALLEAMGKRRLWDALRGLRDRSQDAGTSV